MQLKLKWIAAAVASLGCVSTLAHASFNLARWTFDTYTFNNPGPFAATDGVLASSGVATIGTGNNAMSVKGNGSPYALGVNGWDVGDYFQFKTSATGYENIAITFDQASSFGGPKDFRIEYSLDGSNFTVISDNYAVKDAVFNPDQGSLNSRFNFNLPDAIGNNQGSLYLRLVNTSTASVDTGIPVQSLAYNYVDNVVISGDSIPVITPPSSPPSVSAPSSLTIDVVKGNPMLGGLKAWQIVPIGNAVNNPVVSFSYSGNLGPLADNITFHDNGSSATFNIANPTLADLGTYLVTFTATGADGQTGSATTTLFVVPEPTTLAMLCGSCLFLRRRRRA